MNHLMSDGAVYRTAPATPGLLKIAFYLLDEYNAECVQLCTVDLRHGFPTAAVGFGFCAMQGNHCGLYACVVSVCFFLKPKHCPDIRVIKTGYGANGFFQ